MPKTQFSASELKAYFNKNFKTSIYDDAVKMADAIRVHMDGIYPANLIDDARPNEETESKDYRKKIWKPKTKSTISKVINSLSKIRRSSDWSIQYPGEQFNRIPDGETLADYCETNFPLFESITNWMFSVLLRVYLRDPNAVVMVLPFDVQDPEDPTAFVKPFPHIIESADVIDYIEDDFAILRNPLGSEYTTPSSNKVQRGESFYVVTTESIFQYDQQAGRRWVMVWQHDHMTGELPVKKIGAVLVRHTGPDMLFQSRIDDMVAPLDDAAREYSDLQIGVVGNLFMERWEIASNDCATCNGVGKIPGTDGEIICPTCQGSAVAPNPFKTNLVRRPLAGESNIPTPPLGYVEKNVEIIKLQDERVKGHLFDALAAVNMQFLDKTPLSESGYSKEVDKDETNSFVHSIAEDLVRVADWLYLTIARWRYGIQYDEQAIQTMVPTIPVPEHFDIFSVSMVRDELSQGIKDNFNPVIVKQMTKEFAAKTFQSSDDDVLDVLELVLDLDPLSGISEDDKMTRMSNKGVAPIDYIISCNIDQFVRRAMRDNSDFIRMDYDKQRAILEDYAKAVEIATKPAQNAAIAGALGNDPNNPNPGANDPNNPQPDPNQPDPNNPGQ